MFVFVMEFLIKTREYRWETQRVHIEPNTDLTKRETEKPQLFIKYERNIYGESRANTCL